MATVKFFNVEDDTAILFGANGTALTATLAAVAGMISDIKFSIPTFPMWIYFLGLIFAFGSKMVVMTYNGDIREREKSQAACDFLLEIKDDPNLPDAMKADWDTHWQAMEDRRKILLSLKAAERLNYWRALFFFASAICFLIGTSSIIWFVGTKASV
ncbi:hypothetical protein ELI02_22400 [Rhizobium leguminosarum]|uniref:hypothetical protein n=1 Tax=Rhizobium TaxID=379 RepID=UPI001031DAD4|nr:hypothetical protein [Rhizobium leguminosarum]TAV51339.1 hypothetical protein ELI32_25555 [Rhizobium leguminosarum]TAV60699.1 hypothetical protein ELI31_24090 [Rhizobium leguminosarum]TAV71746.1 hypothetical protein ELI30_24855 [Rhizobium leguminosarum]TAX58253.1 hypothetical protein ELI01_24840 [Rhizobium leguminosarum]TAX62594.1 hypothetical protein ELI02_22400 [Rhizobium leguminosarum]